MAEAKNDSRTLSPDTTQWQVVEKAIISSPSSGWKLVKVGVGYPTAGGVAYSREYKLPEPFLPGTLTIWVNKTIQWEGEDYQIKGDRVIEFKATLTAGDVIRARYVPIEQRLFP